MSEEAKISVPYLPIIEVVKEIYGAFFRNILPIFGTLIIPAFVFIGLSYLTLEVQIELALEMQAGKEGFQSKSMFASITLAFVNYIVLLAMSPYLVHCFNMPHTKTSFWLSITSYRWGTKERSFAKILAVLICISLGLGGISVLMQYYGIISPSANFNIDGSLFFVIFIGILALVITIYFLIFRSIWVFPAAALDASITLKQAWEMSKGSVWRVLWICFLAGLPVVLIALVGMLMLVPAIPNIDSNDLETTMRGMLNVVIIPQTIIAMFQYVIGAFVLSIVYKWLLNMRLYRIKHGLD